MLSANPIGQNATGHTCSSDLSCRWTAGGPDARGAFEIGARLYLYITKDCRQMYLKAHPKPAP